jgi:hypothetical protein
MELPAWPTSSSAAKAGLLFEGASVADFTELVSAAAERVAVVPDPAGSTQEVIRVECNNADVFPLTPTENPRAQLLTPPLWYPRADLWVHGKVFLPNSLPTIQAGKFFQLLELFSPPFEGSPPWQLALGVEEGKEIPFFPRNATYGFDQPWQGNDVAIQRGVWNDFYVRLFFANNLQGGRLEMWWNGAQITFFKPGTSFNPGGKGETTRLLFSLEEASDNEGAAQFYLGNYRAHNTAGMEGTVTLYYWPLKIGTSKRAVS